MTGEVGANPVAIGLFGAVAVLITVLAARRSRSRSGFYNAGGAVSAFSNGLAMAGN